MHGDCVMQSGNHGTLLVVVDGINLGPHCISLLRKGYPHKSLSRDSGTRRTRNVWRDI